MDNKIKFTEEEYERTLQNIKDRAEEDLAHASDKLRLAASEFKVWEIYTDTRYADSMLRILSIDEGKCGINSMVFLNTMIYIDKKTVEPYLINEADFKYIKKINTMTQMQSINANNFICPETFLDPLGFLFLVKYK